MSSEILQHTAALPATETDDERYPILGHLVWYSLRDVRINRTELEQLLIKARINPTNMPAEIRPADAFRRATTSITNRGPEDIGDGKFESIMVREVFSDSNEVVRHIIREETDSQNRRINYGKVGQAVFNRQLEKVTVGMDPRFEHHKHKIMQVYDEYSEYYVGKHIRDIVFKMLNSTTPVSVRPAGGLYFVANTYTPLVESLEEFVTDINAWGVPGTGDAVFESVPMLDVAKQRKLIFDKYESQCAYSVDNTLKELAGLLNSEKTPTKSTLTNYVNKVKELKKGIGKYEELLERDMQLSRTKCQLLQEQVIQLLDKASVSEIVPDVAVPV